MYTKNLVFISILFFLLGSCKKDYKLEKIDSDVLVSAEKTDNGVVVYGESERIYSCAGHQITYCEKTKKNEIYIEFKKVRISDACLMVLGPANCRIELENIKSGEYEVTFELNKKKTKGKLIVGSNVELTLDTEGNVKPI